MGCYDTIYYKCNVCGKRTGSQTKLSGCLLSTLKVGDQFLDSSVTMNLILKFGCEHCGGDSCIKINKGKIIGIGSSEEADHIEGYWGALEEINQDANVSLNDSGDKA